MLLKISISDLTFASIVINSPKAESVQQLCNMRNSRTSPNLIFRLHEVYHVMLAFMFDAATWSSNVLKCRLIMCNTGFCWFLKCHHTTNFHMTCLSTRTSQERQKLKEFCENDRMAAEEQAVTTKAAMPVDAFWMGSLGCYSCNSGW